MRYRVVERLLNVPVAVAQLNPKIEKCSFDTPNSETAMKQTEEENKKRETDRETER